MQQRYKPNCLCTYTSYTYSLCTTCIFLVRSVQIFQNFGWLELAGQESWQMWYKDRQVSPRNQYNIMQCNTTMDNCKSRRKNLEIFIHIEHPYPRKLGWLSVTHTFSVQPSSQDCSCGGGEEEEEGALSIHLQFLI